MGPDIIFFIVQHACKKKHYMDFLSRLLRAHSVLTFNTFIESSLTFAFYHVYWEFTRFWLLSGLLRVPSVLTFIRFIKSSLGFDFYQVY